MFKFDFDLQDNEEDFDYSPEKSTDPHQSQNAQINDTPPFTASTVDELIQGLPSLISFSPLRIPTPGNSTMFLLRRDLFDARFQLISEDEMSQDLEFIDDPSDLVPGVYEGGLKTWECSTDLAGYLHSCEDLVDVPRSYKMIEIGCGTAIPSMIFLQKIFSEPNKKHNELTLHLQDYNFKVLQLMTLPNIILTWYASPASSSYRTSQSLPAVDVSGSGELEINANLLSSFLESLRLFGIKLKFFGGAWPDLESSVRDAQAYDLVVTSETIYQSASVPNLVSLLKVACKPRGSEGTIEPLSHEFAQLSYESAPTSICLVAAKVLYFGVGGGINEFEKVVQENSGRLKVVFEKKEGVGRRIMSLDWSSSG